MTSPRPDPISAPLRVALCPIHFHPATHFKLADGVPFIPLNEPVFSRDFEGDRLLGLLDPQTEEAETSLEALRYAVRSVYLRHFTDRIAEILKACAAWGVQLVVFPEFAIPGECLLPLASTARGMTVVFGSHTVTSSLLRDVSIYKLEGWSAVEEGDTVAPVLMPEGQWRLGARYRPRETIFWTEQDEPIVLPTGHRMMVTSGRPIEGEKPSPSGYGFQTALGKANLLVVPRFFMPGEIVKVDIGRWKVLGFDPGTPARHASLRFTVTCSEPLAEHGDTAVLSQNLDGPSHSYRVPFTESNADRIVIADLDPISGAAPRPILKATLIPHIPLSGLDALWRRVARLGEDTAAVRQCIDDHQAQIRQWQNILMMHATTDFAGHEIGAVLRRCRKRLRQILDPHQVNTLAEMRQALGAFLPLPSTCPTSADLELGLARAVQQDLRAHVADWPADALLKRHEAMMGFNLDWFECDVEPHLLLQQHEALVARANERGETWPGSTLPADSNRVRLDVKIQDLAKQAPQVLADAVREQVIGTARMAWLMTDVRPEPTDAPIQLEHLSLENVRSFASLELPLHSSDPEAGQWILLLGDNGTGKSTILRSLVLAMADRDVASSLVADAGIPFRREGQESGQIRVTVQGEQAPRDASVLPFENREELERKDRTEGARDFNLFAYGCQRGSALGGHAREVSFTPRSDVATLFDEAASLTHAETWLTRLYALALRSNGASMRFYEAVRAQESKPAPTQTQDSFALQVGRHVLPAALL